LVYPANLLVGGSKQIMKKIKYDEPFEEKLKGALERAVHKEEYYGFYILGFYPPARAYAKDLKDRKSPLMKSMMKSWENGWTVEIVGKTEGQNSELLNYYQEDPCVEGGLHFDNMHSWDMFPFGKQRTLKQLIKEAKLNINEYFEHS